MKSKPKGAKYTDLCIYIDKTNYYRDEKNNPIGLRELTDEETENIYSYLYHIIYAMSVKKRLLTKKSDYDIFCVQTAGNLYMRLRRPDQDYTGQQRSARAIKSIRNYLGNALGFMCISWRETNYHQVISAEHDKDTKVDIVKNFVRGQADSQFAENRKEMFNDFITHVPSYFADEVNKSILKKDKKSSYELLLSLYLTLLNASTLKNKQLENYDNCKINNTISSQLADRKPYIITFSNNPIINKDFVDITLKKIAERVNDEYAEAARFVEPTETDIDDILDSAYATYDMDQSGGF